MNREFIYTEVEDPEMRAEITALEEENAELKRLLVHVYNAGYHAGHHDTVESVYVHIVECDMDTYHEDVVGELTAALKEKP